MSSNPGISIFQSNGIQISSPVQNQEEDEDIEEQKRRQEEIHNFLANAMDEFNYDEQSTINSSTNVSIDDTYNNQNNVMQKYKNTDLDDQLKVLYEVRVKEVQLLTEQLEQLKIEIGKQKDTNSKTIMLLEAEKERAKISSGQAQKLLVNKTEEITNLKCEVDSLRATVSSLEKTIKMVNDEYKLCKQSNKELAEQLTLMHSGLTTNTISDRQLQEQHHADISQLHHLLDSANMKFHKKEKDFNELEQMFKELLNEKEVMMTEKGAIVNQLTQNLENALDRCQEFSEIIEKLSQENKTLKLSTSASDLTDCIRGMGVADKTEIVKALQRELDKTREVHNKQKTETDSLRETCEKLSKDCKNLETNNERYKNELDMCRKQCEQLEEAFAKSNTRIKSLELQLEEQRKASDVDNKQYEDRMKLLETDLENYKGKDRCDDMAQTSVIVDNLNDKEENLKLKATIHTLENEIKSLNEKLVDAQSRISQMQLQVSLETERENLIEVLQEKATKFEAMIKQNQEKPEHISLGINTDPIISTKMEDDLLRTKFETDLVQKEIEIRTEVKRDFDLKFDKLQKELAKRALQQQEKPCEGCKELWNNLSQIKMLRDERDKEITLLKQQIREDREAVAVLLEEWSRKFLELENEKQIFYAQWVKSKDTCDQFLLKLNAAEAGDIKLYEVIKKECEETIKAWNKNTLAKLQRYTLAQQEKMKESSKRIEQFCQNADTEVHTIELQFLKKKQLLEHMMHKN